LSCPLKKNENEKRTTKTVEAKMSKTLFNPDADPSDPIIVVGGSYAGQSSSRSYVPLVEFFVLTRNLLLPCSNL
jgi:hypothetical protein